MYSYDRRVALQIGPADTEKWRSDLRRMTKIYKSIPTAPDAATKLEYFLEARGLFGTFHRNFEEWAYDDVLTSRDPAKQNYSEREVAKHVWTALGTLGHRLFPDQWNHVTDKHEPAPWVMEREIDKNITRYQRAFNIAFKAIDDLLQFRKEQGTPDRLEPIELLTVGSVQVVVHNQGREGRHIEEELDDELRTLSDAVARMTRAGFPQASAGLTVHISFVQTQLRAGQYDPSIDELVLYPLGMGRENNETFIHECGHRFYYKALPGNARIHWKAIIDARAVTIESSDIDHMVEKYVIPVVKTHGHTPFRDELMRDIHEESVELEAKCRELADHMPAFTNDPEEVREFWQKNYGGARVNLEEISDYGSTDEKEAFAEAFMLYVTKGPRQLGPWTRQFFETISRGGGAKLSMVERVVARFLEAAPNPADAVEAILRPLEREVPNVRVEKRRSKGGPAFEVSCGTDSERGPYGVATIFTWPSGLLNSRSIKGLKPLPHREEGSPEALAEKVAEWVRSNKAALSDVPKKIAEALDRMLDSLEWADRSGPHVSSEPRFVEHENRVEITFRAADAPYFGHWDGTEEEFERKMRSFEDTIIEETKHVTEKALAPFRNHVQHIGVSYGDKDYVSIWVHLK